MPSETAVSILIGVFNTLVSAALTIILFSVKKSVNEFNRAEDKSDERIKAISEKLHDANVKLIDERFRAVTHQVNGVAQQTISRIDEIREDLDDGAGKFMKLGDQTNELKDYIRDQLHSHEDKVTEKFEAVNERIGELKVTVGILASKVEGRNKINNG